MSYYDEAKALKPYLSALRREFHRHPCVSREEFWTAQRIETELDALGITDHRRVDGTGVYAVFRGDLPGDKVMVLRADTDALPIQELNTHLDYCSQVDGVMHACGHDLHTAALLGGAKLLMAHKGEWGGEVRLIFQHAEEVGWGAKQFVKEGLLEGGGRAFGMHTAPDLPVGVIGAKPGPNNASVDHFTVKIQGKAAHVSTPQLGADAAYIAAQTLVALQALVTRRTAPTDPVIIGVGKLQSGTAYNIVAESALLEGTVRAFSPETRASIRQGVDAVCQQTAALYGGSAQVEWEDFSGPLVNPEKLCAQFADKVFGLLGEGMGFTAGRALSCGGDDFADLQAVVPGIYVYVGTSDPNKPDTCLPLHNDRVDFDEDALPIMAALHAWYATGYLTGELA